MLTVADKHVVSRIDFTRMQVLETGTDKPTPLWTLSDEKVRAVCIHKLMCQANCRVLPKTPAAIKALECFAWNHLRKHPTTARHLEVTERFGGLLAYMVSLIYRRYRLRQNSFDLAAYYGMEANCVRKHLYELNGIARQLFPDKDNHLARPKHAVPWSERKRVPINAMQKDQIEEAIRLRKQGATIPAIAAQLGFSLGTIKRQMRNHGVTRACHKEEETVC